MPAANYRNQTQVSTALQITVAETPYVYHERTIPNPPPSTSRSFSPFYLKSHNLIRWKSLVKQPNKTQIYIQRQHRQFAVSSSPIVQVWQLWHVHNTILPQIARSICRMQATPTCASSSEFRTCHSFTVDRSLASN